MLPRFMVCAGVLSSAGLFAGFAHAQTNETAPPESSSPAPAPVAPAPAPNTQPATTDTAAQAAAAAARETDRLGAANASSISGAATSAPQAFTLGGYAEAFYQWNFNAPSNRLTNYRGFDNQHNTLTLANVALDAQWDYQGVVGRLTLQIGHTPASYYSSEPSRAGSSGVNLTDGNLWRFVQQGYVGYRIPVGAGLLVQAGLFLSPIGPEGMAVRDNWNWSRSNLFFGLPFYHTGARIAYPLSSRVALTLAVYNGWNSVVDNNDEKSLALQMTYTVPDRAALSLLYFTGVERAPNAPEGRAWRHLLDAHITWTPTPRWSFLAHLNGGFEPNNFGVSGWFASALYARVQLISLVALAVRGDFFFEHAASNSMGSAAPMAWPVAWVSSGTFTVEVKPRDRVVARVEYRHDHAASDLYFGGAVLGDGMMVPYVPNRSFQDTVTVGLTTWF